MTMKPETDCSNFGAMPAFSRRAFIGSLIASAVVAGVPLALGAVPAEPTIIEYLWAKVIQRGDSYDIEGVTTAGQPLDVAIAEARARLSAPNGRLTIKPTSYLTGQLPSPRFKA